MTALGRVLGRYERKDNWREWKMKITGTIIEAGDIIVVETTPDQLIAQDGAIYGHEVVVESKADHDARESEVGRLKRENIAAHASAVHAVHDLSRQCDENDRLKKLVESGLPDEPRLFGSVHLAAIADALEHAKAEHPKFATSVMSDPGPYYSKKFLEEQRAKLEVMTKLGGENGTHVLMCEVAEAMESFARKDYFATLNELAQCGAVIVRMMEAVQALVDEAAKAGKEAKE